jgi:predicted TIM-barrel fold metal-dependent hydrolase
VTALNREQQAKLTRGAAGRPRTVTFLPEPERRPRPHLLISVDDHIVEPADLFQGRVPARLADRAPRIVEDPARFDEMRKGAWDVDARVHDMDLNGVYASLNFPSALPGFSGQRLQLGRDPDLAEAVVRAWNDWHIEDWAGAHPDRLIPCQLPWLLDPEVGARWVRDNAERGFHAVTFPEAPEKLGLPSLHTGHWDPFMAACEETGTVICLHIGSSSSAPAVNPDGPPDALGVLFFASALFSAVDWLYSLIPVRFPGIKICLSEGGIAWVAGLLDRLDHVSRYHELYGTWGDVELSPAEVLQRNFWFCALEDPSNLQLRHRIGVENLLLESDYPHLDSTWPNTQALVAEALAGFPDEEVQRITWQNAAELFQHPVPATVAADPESF